jgi:hypothetical protein
MFNRSKQKFPGYTTFNNSKFQSDFDKAERRFNIMWKLVLGFIILVFCAVIAIWCFIGYGVVKYGPKAVQTGEHVLERLDREATSDLN